ncbi:MAG: hypothetical protein HY369_01925 [Candidatus Aenigmarchaeota archaeon]|nr:hypothetical protein [Candidatus Aenigmarchaeota archaeon]
MDLQKRVLATNSPLFWIIFILAGVFFFLRSVEIVAGLLVVLLGVHRLGTEVRLREQRKERTQLQATLEDIRQWMERDYAFLQELRDRYDNRFFNLSKQKLETQRQIDKSYRDLVRKIMDVENKLNQISRAFLTPRPRSGR